MTKTPKQLPLEITVVYNKSNQFGLAKDAELLSSAFAKLWSEENRQIQKVRTMDMREYPMKSDVCIHLEVPVASWFGWAKTHVMVVNPEWWMKDWNCYKGDIDLWVFKTAAAKRRFVVKGICTEENSIVLPWACEQYKGKEPASVNHSDGFVWFCGGSKHKIEAAERIVPLWRPSWGPLTVYTTQKLKCSSDKDGNGVDISGVKVIQQDLDAKTRQRLAAFYPGHICMSSYEGFGYTAAEAVTHGAFRILNNIETYKEMYSEYDHVAWINTEWCKEDMKKPYADFIAWDSISDLEFIQMFEEAIGKFRATDLTVCRKETQADWNHMWNFFYEGSRRLFQRMVKDADGKASLPKHMPPVLMEADCPPISVVTLTHNRPKFIQNACMNLLLSDYPREKIEWIVVDDSEATTSPINDVVNFQRTFAPGKVVYVPVNSGTSIGKKRNKGVSTATNDIILMMDDDDHVPTTSFRRRVAWLTKHPKSVKGAAVCTAIALYDLNKGVSAMNVPPYDLGLASRCSEATLTFTRDFWKERKFADVNMAEGEGFLSGRESQVVEMPPQQILVALQHGSNLSSRLIPQDASPGCFWGFQKELLVFLHGLVGVGIEEDKKK